MQKAPVRNVQTLFCYPYSCPIRSFSIRSFSIRSLSVAEVSAAEVSAAQPNRSTRYKLASYGQKSFKIESNRSNRVLCLICCYLLDFSRSDSFSAINFRLLSVAEALGFSALRTEIFQIESNRSNRVLCLICCYLLDFSRSDSFSAINFRLLSVAEALGFSALRTEIFQIESNRSNRVLCLICCYLLDFSRSDSFSAINFRLLSVAEAPKCRIQIFHILAFVETSYHGVSENHSSFISSDFHFATLFSIYPAMPFISSQSRIIRS